MTVATTGTTRAVTGFADRVEMVHFRHGASPEVMRRIIYRVWTLDREPDIRDLRPRA